MGLIKTFSEFINESLWSDRRKKKKIAYRVLNDKKCTVDLLYEYLIDNYDVLGDDQIKLKSGKYRGNEWYELHVPITLSGEYIETDASGEDMKDISRIDYTIQLEEYVKEMESVVEITDYYPDAENFGVAYTKTDPVLCSEVVDFIDEILKMVPDPALRKRNK